MSKMLWHYTTGDRLAQILESGVVRVARSSALPGERALAWLSANEDFEPTARKCIVEDGAIRVLTVAELALMAGGLARLGLSETAARAMGFMRWPAVAGLGRIKHREVAAMAMKGEIQGAVPTDWWGGRAVLVSQFEKIEFRRVASDSWAPFQNQIEVRGAA